MAKDISSSPEPSPTKATASLGRGVVASLRGAIGGLLADPFRLALALTVNLALVVGIVSTIAILRHRKTTPKPVTLSMAFSALDFGDTVAAKQMAERLAASKDITTQDWGGPDFILGALAARAAEDSSGKQRTESFRLASLFLARSRERGFPEHRESTGLYLLGKSLCLCDRLQGALPVLEQALQQDRDHAAELRLLLIETRLGVQPPELDKALAESEKLLADPQLTDAQRRQALIQQAQVLLRMNRTKQCAAMLNKIPDNPLLRCDVSLLRGRLALCEGQALTKTAVGSNEVPGDAKEKFRLAIDWFRKALNQDLGDQRVARQAAYLVGLCLFELGDLPAALNQMERTARMFLETPEALAALYQHGNIAGRMGRHTEEVSAYRRLVSAYVQQDEFHNPWINHAQLRTTLLNVCQNYLKAEKFETAVLLSKLLVHFEPKAEALQLTAQIYRTWGENVLEQAERQAPERAEELRRQARTQLRCAGDSYLAAAREQYTSRQYPEDLWQSACAYSAGHDFHSAATMLRLYMRQETRLRKAQALVDLGEAQLSLGQTEQALQSFHECIQQHSRDVAVYRARLLASRAAANMGDPKQAESFLQDNLNGEQLRPASKEWRDSLFALAELLHNVGRDREAIQRLDESLQRYPDAPQAIVARYLLADSSRRLATDLRAGPDKEISSAIRGERMSESRRLLERALVAYNTVRDDLSQRDAEGMSALDKAILRNSRFAIGDVCFAQERYREALRAYQSAVNHYAANPEVLEAYLQIANVYRRLDRPAEARTSLEQARIALRRIPLEARFEQTTNYSRKQWGELLDQLCSL